MTLDPARDRAITANRAVKATKIAAYLRTEPPTTAAEVAYFTDADWDRIAPLCGFDSISPATRVLVVSFLQFAEYEAVSDPFRGLPCGRKS